MYLFELSDNFGGQIKLPYSTGLIWSYCLQNKTIKDNYDLKGWFYKRESAENILKRIDNPDIIALSNFVWNTQLNHKLAKEIKKRYPKCKVIFGGLGNPNKNRLDNFFEEYDYIDMIVNGEGELTFENILIESLKDKPDYTNVEGISTKDFITNDRQRIKDIDYMPSPYLDGLFDKLIQGSNETFEAPIESVRGCPYQCTFCEIGDLYFQKIAKQSNKKVFEELDWISKNKIDFVYNADSNFGLLKEHIDIAKYMSNLKNKTGYPDRMMVDWAKSKADKVVELAQILTDSKLLKGITIALQSVNPDVLKAVHRKNVDDGKLKEFIDLYKDRNLKSYIELILGLPLETLQSFKDGIYKILDIGFTDFVDIHPLTALPNTPFFDSEYIKKYGIRLVETAPAFFHHENAEDLINEKEMMVVGSDTMPLDDYVEASLFKWYISFCEHLGGTSFIALLLDKIYDIKRSDFYDKLYEYSKENTNTFLGKEYLDTKEALYLVLDKKQCWGKQVKDKTGNIFWEFQEATNIKLVGNEDIFYNEIKEFVSKEYSEVDANLLDDIIEFQLNKISTPNRKYPYKKKFNFNLNDVMNGKKVMNGGHEYTFNHKNYNKDITTWATEVLWWGRKNKSYEVDIVDLQKTTMG